MNTRFQSVIRRTAAALVAAVVLASCGSQDDTPKSAKGPAVRPVPKKAEAPAAETAPPVKAPSPPKASPEATATPVELPKAGSAFEGKGFCGDGMDAVDWIITLSGDFKEAAVDVVEGRLRLRAGTIGTRDDTVKHLGIRTAEQVVDFSEPVEITAEIDWNEQANGCYLRASIFLCPTRTDGTASNEKDWLKFEYVGVPPGKNGRAVLSRRRSGNLRHLYTEGWPTNQRTGRPIGKQRVVLKLDRENIEVVENGKRWWGPRPHGLHFQKAYLYLEISSHSNYPPRTIFFEDLTVRRLARPTS